MGNAFTGIADDGSALVYNPAGIAFQPGTHLTMDTSVVVGLFRFTPSATPPGQVVPPNGYSQNIKPKFIPLAFFYITHQISSKWTIGFATFTPFGLSANSTNFNDADPNLTKFVGRFAGTRVRLESYWFQPTVAYKINENLAISVAPAFVHTHLFLEESILNPLGYDDGLKFGRTAAPTILPGLPVNQAAAIIARLLPEGRSRIAGTGNAPAICRPSLEASPHQDEYRTAVSQPRRDSPERSGVICIRQPALPARAICRIQLPAQRISEPAGNKLLLYAGHVRGRLCELEILQHDFCV
jgi:hypothetical protein